MFGIAAVSILAALLGPGEVAEPPRQRDLRQSGEAQWDAGADIPRYLYLQPGETIPTHFDEAPAYADPRSVRFEQDDENLTILVRVGADIPTHLWDWLWFEINPSGTLPEFEDRIMAVLGGAYFSDPSVLAGETAVVRLSTSRTDGRFAASRRQRGRLEVTGATVALSFPLSGFRTEMIKPLSRPVPVKDYGSRDLRPGLPSVEVFFLPKEIPISEVRSVWPCATLDIPTSLLSLWVWFDTLRCASRRSRYAYAVPAVEVANGHREIPRLRLE